MSVTYEQAPEAEVGAMVARVMAEHHKHLREMGVTIETLFARKLDKDEEPEAAIVIRRQVCGAKISITSLQDRVRGIADAKLIIDAEYGWDRLPKDQRIAMIDRELCHLTPATDKDGQPKYDDHGRPKLKYRHFDYEISGFVSCLENHGEASIEAAQIRLFQELNGQYCLFQTPASLEVKVNMSKSLPAGLGSTDPSVEPPTDPENPAAPKADAISLPMVARICKPCQRRHHSDCTGACDCPKCAEQYGTDEAPAE